MAGYREFQYEKTYEAPDLGAIDRGIASLGNALIAKQKEQKAKRDAANQFSYDLDKGAFENDTVLLNDLAKDVTVSAKNEIRNTGRVSLDTEKKMKDGYAAQQMSNNQMKRAQELQQDINSKRDIYYNPEPDLKLVTEATHGTNNDIDYRTRGERLADAEKKLGGIQTFRYDKYRADYIKQIGLQSKEKEFPLKSGGSKTIYDQATFWNPEGKPGVTDQHAIRYLESDERVAKYFDQRVGDELRQEIKAMRASGDERVAWMKGMSEADIANELVNDPSKNLINNKDYGVRVRDKAKEDLTEGDRINTKVSYTGLQSDLNNSGGRWKNPNILHDNSLNSFAQSAWKDGQQYSTTTYGPGGRFTQKSGKSVQLDTTNPVRTDMSRGITTKNNQGSMRLNMTGYQLMPVRSGMAPFTLKAPTVEGMIEEINNIPLDYFDPNGKVKLQPEMQMTITGFTVNEAGVLNDIQDQLLDLSAQLRTAQESGDKEKQANLEELEYNLNELKSMVGSGDYDPQDLLLAGNKAGVRKVQQSWVIPASSSDVSAIKNITGGFNLSDKSYWSDDMRAVDDAYRAKATEAKRLGYGGATQQKKTVSEIKTQSDVDKLPKGTKFKWIDGNEYVKE